METETSKISWQYKCDFLLSYDFLLLFPRIQQAIIFYLPLHWSGAEGESHRRF